MEKDKERQSIRTGVKLLFCLLVSGFVFLIACQAVEPEKRAYPQVIGIDWQKEEQRYTVWMHMASLAEDTGQRKQSAETQRETNCILPVRMGRRSILLTKRPGNSIWISDM